MSDTKPIGGRAFPVHLREGENWIGDGSEYGMSLRQYAAITLKVPDSGEEWLDDMIRQSLRDEMAGKAMAAHCSDATWRAREGHSDTSRAAYKMADAMLKSREQ